MCEVGNRYHGFDRHADPTHSNDFPTLKEGGSWATTIAVSNRSLMPTQETREWLDSLEYVLQAKGIERATFY